MRTKLHAGLLPALASALLPACNNAPDQPNIILIVADDLGYSDLGCYGGEISTPNLDRLAQNGVRFTQFYNTARSCPSRASLLTGLNPHQTGLGAMTGPSTDAPGYRGEISQNCITIAEALKEAGYGTYMTGKWHLTHSLDGSDKHNWPLQRGFDSFFGTINGGGNYYNPSGLLHDNEFIEADSGFYYTDRIASQMISFIRNHLSKQNNKPFFSYVAFTAPHWPLHAPDSLVSKYYGKYSIGWDSLRAHRLEKQKAIGIVPENTVLSARNPEVQPWEASEYSEWQQRRMEVYAAQVESMDKNIGRLLNLLTSEKILDNTLIFFLSDNGGCAEELDQGWKNFLVKLAGSVTTREGDSVSFCNDPDIMPGPETTFQSVGLPWANAQNTPFRLYKMKTHEGGISTPLIVSWPAGGIKRGRIITEPGMLMDIMATCIDVAHTKYPAEYRGNDIIPPEGFSLMPVIKRGKHNPREIMCWEHLNSRAVRMNEWKLVSEGPAGKWELYNISNDRIESVNLATIYPERKKELEKLWIDWAKRTHVFPKPIKK